MLILLTWLMSGEGGSLSSWERAVVGLVFAAACVFGILRSTRPSAFKFLQGATSVHGHGNGNGRSRAGHHPDCDGFNSHVIEVGSRKRCAGCLGLAIGSALGLASVPGYLLINAGSAGLAAMVAIAGFSLVAVAIIETAVVHRSAKVHVVANAVLVLGFAAVVYGTTDLSSSLYVGLLAVLLCYLWLDTRIKISETRHARICAACTQDCKAY